MTQKQMPEFNRVMLIDDNNIDLYVAERLIAKIGFADNILRYTSAREALQYLVANSDNVSMLPEILFVDIYMPDMSGFEFMDEYAKLPQPLKDYCRAYIVSSSLDENDIARSNADENVVAFFEKPLNENFLHNISG
jgi:CheY-like chemotaxis protein